MAKCVICKKNEALPYLVKFFPDTAICKECIQGYKELMEDLELHSKDITLIHKAIKYKIENLSNRRLF